MASLRLEPHLHSHQLKNVLRISLFEGNNAGTGDLYANIEYNAFDNMTIKQNNTRDNINSAHSGRCGAKLSSYNTDWDDSKLSNYATTVQYLPHTGIAQFDYTKFNDYDGLYNSEYNSNYDSLSTCSDMTACTTTTARKLYLQKQRKYAIMMAMTTASVIASGETRVPVQRITERNKSTILDRSTERFSVTAPALNEANKSNCTNIDHVLGVRQDDTVWIGSKLESKSDETTVQLISNPSVLVTNNLIITAEASSLAATTNAITKYSFEKPSSSLLTTTRKLPKRLPTPKYNSSSNSFRKINTMGKKLPQLPIESQNTGNSSGLTYLALTGSKVLTQPSSGTTSAGENGIKSRVPLTVTSTGELSVGNNTLVSVDTFVEANFLPSSETSPSKLTKISNTAYSRSYQKSYLTDGSKTTEVSATNKCEMDSYLASIKPYTSTLSEEMVSSTTIVAATTLTNLSLSSKIKNVAYNYHNLALSSNTKNDTVTVTTTMTKTPNTFADSNNSMFIYNSNNLKGYFLESNINNNVCDLLIEKSVINSPIMPTTSLSTLTSLELPLYLKQDTNVYLNSNSHIDANTVVGSFSSFLHATSLPATLSSLPISKPLYTYIALPTTSSVTETVMALTALLPQASSPKLAINLSSSSRQVSSITNNTKYCNICMSNDNDRNGYIAISSCTSCKMSTNTYTTSGVFDTIIFDTYCKQDINSYFMPPTRTTSAAVTTSTLTAIAPITAAAATLIMKTNDSYKSTTSQLIPNSVLLTSFITSAHDSKVFTTTGYASSTSSTLPLKTFATTETVMNFFEKSYPLNIIKATSPTATLANDKRNACRLFTTNIELAKIAISATSSRCINTIADNTIPSNTDYLTQYQTPVKLSLDTANDTKSAKNHFGITNEIKSDLPEYVSDFLNCEITKTKIKGKYGTLSSTLNGELYPIAKADNIPLNASLSNGVSIVTDNCIVNITSTEDIAERYTTSSSVGQKYTASDVLHITTTTETLPGNITYDSVLTTVTKNSFKNITQNYTIRELLSVSATSSTGFATDTDSGTFPMSYSIAPTLFVEGEDGMNYISVNKTNLPSTSKSFTFAFNDNFYDSYNVDWSELDIPVIVKTDIAPTIPKTIATDNVSYKDLDAAKIELLKTTLSTDTIISKMLEVNNYCPALLSNENPSVMKVQKRIPATGINASLGVSGKTPNMFNGLSKGIKNGIDGVLGVNSIVTTSDNRIKEQQKKSGFGFGIASKFVPNVGGLIAGATAAVQPTHVIKADKASYARTTLVETNVTITANAMTSVITATTTSYKNLYTSNIVIENGNNSNDNYEQFYGAQNGSSDIQQFCEPADTNSNINKLTKYHISGNALHNQQRQILSNVMKLNSSGSDHISADNDDIIYMQQQKQLKTVAVKNDIVTYNTKGLDDEHDYIEYHETMFTAGNGDNHNVTYADQMPFGNHENADDCIMANTTSYENDNLMTTFYHQQQEHERLKIPSTKSLMLPSLTSFGAHVQIQESLASGDSANVKSQLPSSLTAVPFKPAAYAGGDNIGSSMFGSLLGKAAAAMQSATQAVNQATTAVQQKASSVTLTAAATTSTSKIGNKIITETITNETDGYELKHNHDYMYQQQEKQQILISKRTSWTSQKSDSTANGIDCENRNLCRYDNSGITTANQLPAEEKTIASPQHNNYYLNDNQVQLQQSGKILPTVPQAGSISKKLPTINTNKTGFLMKPQPTEIYDDNIVINDIADNNEHQLLDTEDINKEIYYEDEGINKLEDKELCNIDGNKLDGYIVDDRICQNLNQQLLQHQMQPNYDIDSEEANDYVDIQLQTMPSDLQRNFNHQHQQRHLASNSYYEHLNGGYKYRDDYFNEEDEYKYLANEQELFNKQQVTCEQKQPQRQQNSCQIDNIDLYLEENYQSEDSYDYIEENLSSNVIGPVVNTATNISDQLAAAEQRQSIIEDAAATSNVHLILHSAISEVTVATSGVRSCAYDAPVTHSQHQIRKQSSIIIEEEEDIDLLNETGVISNNALSKNKRLSHKGKSRDEPMHENGSENIMAELPLLTVASKKKVLRRGETEEVVGGQIHILRKQEVTAKQRWHWAYNKVIIQLNVSII